MTHGLLPVRTARPVDPQPVVESFLAALAEPDLAGAGALLDEAVVYTNVGLPTIRGPRRVVRFLSLLDRPGCRFEVYLHAVAADGSVVLTERTDVIELGRVRLQFWVTGRFDVQAGQITLWRDSFDYLDCTRAFVRALVGVVVPPLRPRPPASVSTAPGRHAR